MMKATRCVVIGGGTGSFTVLSALKTRFSTISALVSMADDGSSTGVLRDELGVLPPGDIRQCLVALSEAPDELRRLFNFRFSGGSLDGHSFGNLFLSAAEKAAGSFDEAVRLAGDVLRIRGEVIPITLDDVRLVLRWQDGTSVRGEGKIDTMHFAAGRGLPELSLEPRARLNPAARLAIAQAELIVLAPGDLYTSLGPLLAVDGVSAALQASSAQKVYVCNLVTKPGQTTGMTVSGHAAEIERLAGSRLLDVVLYNTAKPAPELLSRYLKQGEALVSIDQAALSAAPYRALGRSLLPDERSAVDAADPHKKHRSLIRHDTEALGEAISALV